MTVFDHGIMSDRCTFLKLEDGILTCSGSKVSHATFRNYPNLQVDGLCLEECVFENCHTVNLSDCKVENCRFDSLDTLYANSTQLSGCEFVHLRCDDDCVLSLEDSEVSYCSFSDVKLINESHLISGVGDVWVESCSFENVCTDRDDRELFYCEGTVGKIFKKKVQLCMVDESSCSGLDKVKCTGDAEDAAPYWHILAQADQKGLLTEEAVEALQKELSWDASRWDAKTLGLSLADLVMKIPVYNCLTHAGLRTVGDLVNLDILQILQIQYVGKVVIKEVVEQLHRLGITDSAWDYLL